MADSQALGNSCRGNVIASTVATPVRSRASSSTAVPTVEAITLSSHAGSSVKIGCLGTTLGVSFGRTSYEQLQDIVTPVKVDRLEHWLDGYPEGQRNYLINGFTNGIGIECHENPSASAKQCTTVQIITNQPLNIRKL